MNLTHAIQVFLGQYKPSTRRALEYPLLSMAEYVGPARPVDSIKPEHLIEYAAALEERPYAPVTVRKHIKSIKTFFNWLVKIDALIKSPAVVIKAKRLQAYVSRDKAMTDGELERILSYVKWKPRDHALLLFLADTGCRAGGAAGLKDGDLDLEHCSAVVTEKGEKTRPVAYGVDCARAIRVWLLKRPREARYVFSRSVKPMTAAAVSQIVRRACKKVGVRSLGAHSLRHRKGHQLADAKVAVSTAATALGHSDVLTTLHYYYPRDWASAEKELRKLAHHREAETGKIIQLPVRGKTPDH